MTKPKNWTPGKTKKKLNLWHKLKSEILTKLKNLNYLKTKNSNLEEEKKQSYQVKKKKLDKKFVELEQIMQYNLGSLFQ